MVQEIKPEIRFRVLVDGVLKFVKNSIKCTKSSGMAI